MNNKNLILKKQTLVDIADAIREKADVNGLIKIDNLDEAIRALSADDGSIMNYIDETQTAVKDTSGNLVLRRQTLTNIADAIREQSGTEDLIAIGNLSDAVRTISVDKVVPYLTFSSPSTFTLNVIDNKKYWNGTLEYSTDANVWSEWDGISVISSSTDGKLYMRGIENTYITGGQAGMSKGAWVFTGSDISCSGNIENLLDYQTVANGEHPKMANYCYNSMFRTCANLINAPELPATSLSQCCYRSMFSSTSLTNAPKLPATTLVDECYAGMFAGCSGLTSTPELPATVLAKYCYSQMFEWCTGLTSTPELPVTVLAEYCYSHMFNNCTSLTSAPELPATTMVKGCYSNMFNGCTNLTGTPKLPATTLADNCYTYMFMNCTGLTSAPELPATTLNSYCYSKMFYSCTGLTSAPELPATTLANYCYNQMFDGCTGLTSVPELPATTLANYCYYQMFQNCTSLTTLPKLHVTTLKEKCYYQMFRYCKEIKLSTTQTGDYQTEYRIPTSGSGTTASSALSGMFKSTGGTFTSTPSLDTTYYTSNTVI